VTGPASVSQPELAELASELAGVEIVYQPISVEERVAAMIAAGLSPTVAEIYASFDIGVARGTFDVVSTVVADLTGAPPTSVADFVAEHRDEILAIARR
jgi:NAD(P)H dehydrogenase (quinone)